MLLLRKHACILVPSGLAMLPYQVKCPAGAPLALVNRTYDEKFLVCHSV